VTTTTKLVVVSGLTYARYLGRKLDTAVTANEPIDFNELQEYLHNGLEDLPHSIAPGVLEPEAP